MFGMISHRIDRATYCFLIMAVSISLVRDDRYIAISLPTLRMNWGDRLMALAQIAEVDLECKKVVDSHNLWKSH
jgi:hypothetical protein